MAGGSPLVYTSISVALSSVLALGKELKVVMPYTAGVEANVIHLHVGRDLASE